MDLHNLKSRDARNILGNDYDYVISKFRNPVFDESTGLALDTIKTHLMEMSGETIPRPILKARMFAYIADSIQIDVSEHDFFPAFACYDRNDRPIKAVLTKWKNELFEKLPGLNDELHVLLKSGSLDVWPDFDHSVPDWDALYTYGFSGLRERAEQYRKEREQSHALSEKEKAYFDSIDIAYNAVLQLLNRLYRLAVSRSSGHDRLQKQAECLKQLMNGAPRNTYEVLQLIFLYFIFSEHLGHLQEP